MSTVYLVTGGARSGKSGYAQRLCECICSNPIYLATSKVWDDDFADRIKRHQNDRGQQWTTVEEPKEISKHAEKFSSRAILVDCLTLWLTNYFLDEGAYSMPQEGKDAKPGEDAAAAERALEKIKAEFNKATQQWDATFVFVTNEIGSGTHAESEMGRKFVDMMGWLNQHVGYRAERVIHMVCGQPNHLKSPDPSKKSPLATPAKQKVVEAAMLDKLLSSRALEMEAKGYFLVGVNRENSTITAKFFSCIKNEEGKICDLDGVVLKCDGDNPAPPAKEFECRTAKEMTVEIFERWEKCPVASLVHAAYLGREFQKAEAALYDGTYYQQD